MLDLMARAMNSATSSGKLDVFVFGLFLQNGDLGFEVGRLDVGDQAPLEPRAQALFDGGDFLRRAIGGDHDLLLQVVERVERVKEFFLRALAPAMNWISSTISTSIVRKRSRKPPCARSAAS